MKLITFFRFTGGAQNFYYFDTYITPGGECDIDWEYTADFETQNYVDVRITNQKGRHFYEFFELPGPPLS